MSFIFYSSTWLEAPFTARQVTRFLRVHVCMGKGRPPLGVDLCTRHPSSLSLPGDDFGRSAFSPPLDLPPKAPFKRPPDLR